MEFKLIKDYVETGLTLSHKIATIIEDLLHNVNNPPKDKSKELLDVNNNACPIIRIKIDKINFTCLVDTGSKVTG